MARNRQELLSAAIKRSLRDPITKRIESDYTMKEINSLLTGILGKPGVSAGRSSLAPTTSSSSSGPSAYTSAQTDSPKSTSMSFGSSAITGVGLIRDLIGMAYNRRTDTIAYNRQNEFYNNHLSMPAKVQEYQDAGLNPMALGGAGVGATSAPSVQGTGMEGDSALVDVLGQLLNYKARMAEIGIEKEKTKILGDNVASQIQYRTEQTIYQQKVNDYYESIQDATLEKIEAENDLTREKLKTEKTQQDLNAAGISLSQAEAALKAQETLQKMFENSPAYRQNQLALQRAQSNALNADAAKAYEEIENLDAERLNLQADTALKWAQTDIGKQQLKNLGLEEKQIQFMVDHQRGDLIWQRVGQTVGMVKDVAVGAGAIVAGSTGLAAAGSALGKAVGGASADAVSKTIAGMAAAGI